MQSIKKQSNNRAKKQYIYTIDLDNASIYYAYILDLRETCLF